MPSIIIPATKSLTVTNEIPDGNINGEAILVGNDGKNKYFSYLFFDISAIPIDITITGAELVLFKINDFFNDDSVEFCIYPLQDYFSSYTSFKNPPNISRHVKKNFYPLTSKVAVSINLTAFVSLWYKNGELNTGILLFSKSNGFLAKFGSSISNNCYLKPFIKVSYTSRNTNNCYYNKYYYEKPTIKEVQVIGTVAPDSKYEAVIDVEVMRGKSAHIDNYYVVDEYDNLSEYSPLNINKTYNIPIVPKETDDDISKINFYGSYKNRS